MEGPDPAERDDVPHLGDTLLPWPVRCLAVLGVFVAAGVWKDTGLGQQASFGLQYGAAVLVAMVASFWLVILLADLLMAAAWFVRIRPRAEKPFLWEWLQLFTFVNRQIGHLVALLFWMLLVLAAGARLHWQLGGLAAVLFLGAPILNGIARSDWASRFLGADGTSKRTGDLLWRRRILIYAATLLAVVLLAAQAPRQLLRLLPLFAAFLPGLALRTVRHLWRNRAVEEESEARLRAGQSGDVPVGPPDPRAAFRASQARLARAADPLVPALLLAVVAGLMAISWWQRRQLDQERGALLDGPATPADACARDPGGPARTEVELFAMADAQLHELAGEPHPGRLELIDAFVRSATRPTAHDMLAVAAMAHFRALHARLAADRKEQKRPLWWAHLGDLADVSCRGELARMADLLDGFGPQIAGIAPGNHEGSFTGSLHWSPFWDDACATGLLAKSGLTAELVRRFGAKVRAAGGELVRRAGSPLSPRGGSLAAVTPLGLVTHQKSQRGLVGVFLDTSDGGAFDHGMPGTYGALSSGQVDDVLAAIDRLKVRRGGPYADPVYLLFAHFPYDDLARWSQRELDRLVAALDRRPAAESEPDDPRVLALVSGHAHAAGAHDHCVHGRVLREVVIGSTTDLPQQAALLEVGPAGDQDRGALALRVRTVHAVAREGRTCDDAVPAVADARCRQIAAALLEEPACRPLLAPAGAPPRDCQALELPAPLSRRLEALRLSIGPTDPRAHQRAADADATRLLRCLCRDGRCAVPAHPTRDEAYYPALLELTRNPAHRDEAVCLGWAAAATQEHETWRMTMGEAVRCAFDDPSLPAERVTVALLEGRACRR